MHENKERQAPSSRQKTTDETTGTGDCNFPDLNRASPVVVAAAYLAQGWSLVPVDIFSRSLVLDGRPARDVAEIEGWQEQDISFAVATGKASGIVAVRCGTELGGRTFRALARNRKKLKSVRVRLYPGGPDGTVFLFRAPAEKLPSRQEIAPGWDFLGEGGHFSPLHHLWKDSPEKTIAPLPEWLRALATGEEPFDLADVAAAGDLSVLNGRSPQQAAQAYHRLGWRLVAVDGQGGLSSNHEKKTRPPEFWQQHPEEGVGVIAGSRSGVVGLLIESGCGKELREVAGGQLPKPQASNSYVTVVCFQAPQEKIPSQELAPGVEYLGESEFVPLPPSSYLGRKLSWQTDKDCPKDLPELPEWLRSVLTDKAVRQKLQPTPPPQQPKQTLAVSKDTGSKASLWLGTAAQQYARRGWSVFPLWPSGKKPRTKRGFKDATTAPQQVADWWEKWRSANIGLATGTVSGVVALDVDCKAGKPGLESLDKLEAEHGELVTLRARTPSGGQHLFFRVPAEGVGCKTDFLPGLDFRGDGGYVVVAPSQISGKAYRWENEGTPIAEMPAWLLELVGTKTKKAKGAATEPVETLTIGEALAGVQEGSRNDTIFRLACMLRQDGWDFDQSLALVRTAAGNCNPPLDEEEALQCLESAWRYEPPLALSDLGNAERFVARCGGQVRFDPDKGRWLVWSGHCWQANRRAVFQMAKATVRSLRDEAKAEDDPKRKKQLLEHGRLSETKERLESMLVLAGAELSVRTDGLDRPGLAAFADGVFDAAIGRLRPGQRGDLLTRLSPVAFDPASTECREWLRKCGCAAPAKPTAATAWGDKLDRWLAERCEVVEGCSTRACDLLADFAAWLGAEVTPRRFGDTLAGKGFAKRNSNGIVYDGLRLRG